MDEVDFDSDFKLKVISEKFSFFTNSDDQRIDFTNSLEVKTIIREELRAKGAPGLDNITNKMLKMLPNIYFDIFAAIFNASLRLSYLPSQWKKAVVIMLLKALKDALLVNSYRAISLLSCVSKLFERIVLRRIKDWSSSNNILSKYQSGFRFNRQTKDHIFRLIQDVQAAFNRGYKVGSIFIDIEKAFDKVWHAGLLYKLNRLGILNYLGKWIANYLEDRSFIVRCDGVLSTTTPIEAGVPQGSVLGPVLFNIFFNDIVDTKGDVNLSLFADDVAAWTRGLQLTQTQKRLQTQLDAVEYWMSKWRTSLSVSKTTYLVFQKNRQFAKFIGLTLDPSLKMNAHAKTVYDRAIKRVNMLKRLRGLNWGASSKIILSTYKSLIQPIIDYVPFAAIIMDQKYKLKLERLQRAAIRVAIRLAPHTSASSIYPILERAKDLKVNKIPQSE